MRFVYASSTLNAGAALSVSAEDYVPCSASIAATASLTASPMVIRKVASGLLASATMTASGYGLFVGASQMIAGASLATDAMIVHNIAIGLQAAATLAADTFRTRGITVSMNATSLLIAVGVTAFELRGRNKQMVMPILPKYPSRTEELIEWARFITRAVDMAFRSSLSEQNRVITVGRLADLPAPTGSQMLYWAVDDNAGQGRLYFDDGTWRPV